MSELFIKMLGEFQITKEGQDVLKNIKNSKKKVSLLAYLIANDKKAVSSGTLIENIWGIEEDRNFESSLKTLVSRLRKDLAAFSLGDSIETLLGAYMWKPKQPYSIDVIELDTLCGEVIEAQFSSEELQNKIDRILYLYTGNLLMDNSLGAWVASNSFYYRNRYFKAIYTYIDFLNKDQKYYDIIRVCRIGLQMDYFDSILNLELMSALTKVGRSKEALEHYQYITKLQYNYFGSKPTSEILDFYKTLISSVKNADTDIDTIRSTLQSTSDISGAFVCEYSIFKDIYQFQLRIIKRLNIPFFLVLTEIQSLDNKPIEPLILDKVMKHQLDILVGNLRSSDVVTKYSSTQYVLLLSAVRSHESGRFVMERIKGAFYKNRLASKIIFRYNLAPVETEKTGSNFTPQK